VKRVLGIAAIVLVVVVVWWASGSPESRRATRGTVSDDARPPHPVAPTSDHRRRMTRTIAAPVLPWVAHLDGSPKVIRGELHTATTALLEAAVEQAVTRCADTASQDVHLEADVTLVDGTTTEADVLADPHTEYPAALVDCVRDALASSDLRQTGATGDTAVVRLPLAFEQATDALEP
jgi:hypothetical protein